MSLSFLALCALAAGSRPGSPREKRRSPCQLCGRSSPPNLRKSSASFEEALNEVMMNWVTKESSVSDSGLKTPTDQGVTPLDEVVIIPEDDELPEGTIIEGVSLFGEDAYSFGRGALPPKTIQTTTPAPCSLVP